MDVSIYMRLYRKETTLVFSSPFYGFPRGFLRIIHTSEKIIRQYYMRIKAFIGDVLRSMEDTQVYWVCPGWLCADLIKYKNESCHLFNEVSLGVERNHFTCPAELLKCIWRDVGCRINGVVSVAFWLKGIVGVGKTVKETFWDASTICVHFLFKAIFEYLLLNY